MCLITAFSGTSFHQASVINCVTICEVAIQLLTTIMSEIWGWERYLFALCKVTEVLKKLDKEKSLKQMQSLYCSSYTYLTENNLFNMNLFFQ